MLEMLPGEQPIDKWIMNLNQGGGWLNGDFVVTNQRVAFFPKNAMDFTGGINAYRVKNAAGLVFNKNDIAEAKKDGNFLQRKIVLVLKDGQHIVFNRGAMSVDGIIAAINSR